MKNKKLIFAVILIFAVLGFNFIKDSSTKKIEHEEKIPTIGILQYVSHPSLDIIYKGIRDAIDEAGYVEGDTINIIHQNGQADQSKLSTMSQQLLSKEPNVLIGIATPAAQSLANQTDKVPIILGAISDPESAGLVETNDHPGGNITGVSDQAPIEAQLNIMKEILPNKNKIGIIYSSAEDNSISQVEQFKELAIKEGYIVTTYAVPSTNEVTQMTQVMAQEVDMIYTPTDNTIANSFQSIVSIANQYNVPIFPSVDSMVAEGGVATVGINQYELGKQTGMMAVDVLEGRATPSDTPIYVFQSGDTVINELQADLLGINIPESIRQEVKK